MEAPRETRSYVSTEEHLHAFAVAAYHFRHSASARALDYVVLTVLCIVAALTLATGLALLDVPWWPALVVVGAAPFACRWHVTRTIRGIEQRHAAQSPPGDSYTIEWGDDEWEISGKRGLTRVPYDAHAGADELEGYVFVRAVGNSVVMSLPRSVVPDWALVKLQGKD